MWGLFTRALTLATSTTRVSIINTSSNFMLTALLGLIIFSESLPGLWWLGAAFLVAGSVVIGAREEGQAEKDHVTVDGTEGEGDVMLREEREGGGEGEEEQFVDEPDAPIGGASTSGDQASRKEEDEAYRDSVEVSGIKNRMGNDW